MSRESAKVVERRRHEMNGHTYDFELSWDDTKEAPTWIDVECAELGGRVFGDGLPEDGAESYNKLVGTCDEPVFTFAEADKLFKVAVKWDGCAHWDLSAYHHTCGDDEPTALFAAHAFAYQMAKQIMWDAGSWLDSPKWKQGVRDWPLAP